MHSRKDLISATEFIRKLRGGSQPVLVGASDGKRYVVKFANNLQGPNVLCNEVLGTELYRTLGIPTPPWKPIFLSEKFVRRNPGCRIDGPGGWIEPEGGLCFGSELVGESTGSLFEILPGSYWARVSNRRDFWLAWLIDLCAEHWDNRQAVFVQDSGVLSAIFIDHGHMFGGPDGSRKTPVLGPRHLDRRVYVNLDEQTKLQLRLFWANINADDLSEKVAKIPDSWATDSGVRNFLNCVERLSRADTWQNALEAMIASFESPDANACTLPILDRVLRSCLRLANTARSAVA